MTVPADTLELLQFGREFIDDDRSLAKKIGTLEKMVRDKHGPTKVVEGELVKLTNSDSVSEMFPEKLAESDKFSKSSCAEVAFLKGEVPRAD